MGMYEIVAINEPNMKIVTEAKAAYYTSSIKNSPNPEKRWAEIVAMLQARISEKQAVEN